MDYEKKYKEILERAKKIHDTTVFDYDRVMMEDLFPELAESKDDRIKKEMISWLKSLIGEEEGFGYTEDEIRERIACLEKQGEQPQGKSTLEVWKDMRLEVYQQASGNRHEPNYSDDNTKMFSLTDIDEIFEKIAEMQKPVDKVEPKFKIGDWI